MISQKMADAINEQIKNEFYSAWLYLSMAFKMEAMSLKVFAQWFFQQEAEERMHATKMCNYLLDQGHEVKLTALDQPKHDYKNVEEIVSHTVEHEIEVTNMIHRLVNLALEEKDNATFNFLQWFVEEQVEEVATANELLDLVKLAGPNNMLLLEERLKEQVAVRNAGEGE